MGFVAALHVLMIWALADGLLPKLVKSPPPQTDVVVLAEPAPPKPPEPVARELPPSQLPQPVWMPMQDPIEITVAPEHAIQAHPSVAPPPEGPMQATPAAVPAPPAATYFRQY